jgi:hypothetical protein
VPEIERGRCGEDVEGAVGEARVGSAGLEGGVVVTTTVLSRLTIQSPSCAV